ncbi:hypothetical protein [Gorillibacterium timonense]|nr:hypothetical protein [Gorillibacterium timonense]
MKKKPSYAKRYQKQEPNKKAIIWVSSIAGAVIVLMIALLLFT